MVLNFGLIFSWWWWWCCCCVRIVDTFGSLWLLLMLVDVVVVLLVKYESMDVLHPAPVFKILWAIVGAVVDAVAMAAGVTIECRLLLLIGRRSFTVVTAAADDDDDDDDEEAAAAAAVAVFRSHFKRNCAFSSRNCNNCLSLAIN